MLLVTQVTLTLASFVFKIIQIEWREARDKPCIGHEPGDLELSL